LSHDPSVRVIWSCLFLVFISHLPASVSFFTQFQVCHCVPVFVSLSSLYFSSVCGSCQVSFMLVSDVCLHVSCVALLPCVLLKIVTLHFLRRSFVSPHNPVTLDPTQSESKRIIACDYFILFSLCFVTVLFVFFSWNSLPSSCSALIREIAPSRNMEEFLDLEPQTTFRMAASARFYVWDLVGAICPH